MEFASPSYLFLLLIAPALGVVYFYSFRRREKAFLLFSRPDLLKLTNPSLSKAKPVVRQILVIAALSLFIISAARPQWGYEYNTIRQKETQIMIVFDISSSMTARDTTPCRLQRARKEVDELLNIIKGEEIGLVAFSGMSILKCPLTRDYEAFKWFLDSLSTKDIPIYGTDIGQAIQTACAGFTNSAKLGGRYIILITDGEDHEGNIKSALAEAIREGISVHVLGVGEDYGCPIPLAGDVNELKKGSNGELIISRLNEFLLRDIATETGGVYVHADSNRPAMAVIYNRGIKDQRHGNGLDRNKRKTLKDRFQLFLIAGLIIFGWVLTARENHSERQRL
ncbi:MAG: VWA domain-containing protein [Proteobacteria bacterium]|nr:VWA domain-containing protein [Pseudomonadota bacterium]